MAIGRIVCVLLTHQLLVFGTIDRIQKALEKNEFEKAAELILKGYEKEPNNPGISYYHAVMLFNTTYDHYNPDSARIVVKTSLNKYKNANSEVISELIDEGITVEKIELLEEQIKNFLFQKTLEKPSLISIQDYRNKYPNSAFDDILIFKRDSIVFDEVKKKNSEASFANFISKYPTSVFKLKADSILDDLRFQSLREKGNLEDYYAFLKRYPLTRWGRDIENYILKISTASHAINDYSEFIAFSRDSYLKKKAGDLLYYISSSEALSNHPLKDSIEQVVKLSKLSLFPTMDRDLFGFYSTIGSLQIPYLYDDVQHATKCTTSNDDWIFVNDNEGGKIIDKTNKTIINLIQGYEMIGNGLALVEQNDKKYLYHKSGFKITSETIDDADVLNEKWIKIKKNNKWGLYTFLGVPIAESRYDDIYLLGNFWVFEKNGLLGVYTEELILDEIEDRGLSLEFKFEDIELVDSTMLIGFRGERECLMDSKMNFLIPWGEYEIYPDAAGWYLRTKDGYQLYNNTDERVMNRNYPYLESNAGWLALKTENDWILIPNKSGSLPSRGYDSLKIINHYAVLSFKDEETILQFSNGVKIGLEDHQVRSFQSLPQYVLLSNKGSLGVYDSEGSLVVDGKFSDLTFLNDSLMRVSIREKQGLLTTNGDFLLNPLFNSLDEKNGLVLTLMKGKIGCLDLKRNNLISPKYEARITTIGNNYLVKKEGKFGVVDGNENPILGFKYDEIQIWNDTSFLVTQAGEKVVIDMDEAQIIEPLEKLSVIFQTTENTIYRYIKNGKFGLISNQEGVILEPEFTDIFNIGEANNPLFFADQNLAKAGFHVVSYIDQKGNLIFSKAYRKQEFDKILCDN